MSGRRWLNTTVDVAEAVAENPPDIPGWEIDAAVKFAPPLARGASAVAVDYIDDDGAVAHVILTITDVQLDERRVKPDPPEREKGDDGRC